MTAPNEQPAIVWVAESGLYEQRCISGVFSNLEAAKASYPTGPDGWEAFDLGTTTEWLNGLDWDAAVRITSRKVEDTAA